MNLYQLGEYNSRNDLSIQATEIRDFVKTNYDYDAIANLISKYTQLEHESIIILKKAILAGYWTSEYGFYWTKEQEIKFWEIVYDKKPPDSGIAYLTLAESYRGNKVKSLKDVLDLYLKAIEINPEHYYSLTNDGEEELDILLEDSEFRKKCILIELNIWDKLHNYTLQEINEEIPYILNKCKGDNNLENIVKVKIAKIIEKRTTSNK